MEKSHDQMLMRAKDWVVILGVLATWALFGFNFLSIPSRVDASEGRIASLELSRTGTDLALQKISIDVAYIAEAVKEMKKKESRV